MRLQKAGFDSIDVSDIFIPEASGAKAASRGHGFAPCGENRPHHFGTGGTCPILRYHRNQLTQAAATLACWRPRRMFSVSATGGLSRIFSDGIVARV